MGDLNFNLLDLSDKQTEQFTDTMFNYNFYPLINKPTRITDSSSSAIDHIWTNLSNTSIKSGIIAHCVADHLTVIQVSIIGKIKTNSVPNVSRARPIYRSADIYRLISVPSRYIVSVIYHR